MAIFILRESHFHFIIPEESGRVKTWERRTLSLSKGACRRELVEGSLSKGAKFKNPASTSSAGGETKRFRTG